MGEGCQGTFYSLKYSPTISHEVNHAVSTMVSVSFATDMRAAYTADSGWTLLGNTCRSGAPPVGEHGHCLVCDGSPIKNSACTMVNGLDGLFDLTPFTDDDAKSIATGQFSADR